MKHIELNTFLKVKGLANTGGQAKLIIKSGDVKVNGEAEKRNKRKLYPDDTVEYSGNRLKVEEDVCLKE